MKVGDYVRTTYGDIGIIIECPEKLKNEYGRYIWFETTNEQRPIISEYVIKSSPNIIDLIEVGDYVNGSKVIKIEEYNDEKYIYVEEMEFCNACNEDENVYYKEDTINSILTKEQFESMEYKVGDENER